MINFAIIIFAYFITILNGLLYDGSHSGLDQIPSEMPNEMVSLNLRDNSITNVPKGVFETYLELEVLNLSQNQIYVFSYVAFSSQSIIRVINLKNNLLTSVPDFSLIGQTLTVLDLSYNDITELPSTAFSELNVLQNLSLEYNQNIDWIGPQGLYNPARTLITLNLNHAWDLYMDESDLEFLYEYENLKMLDISYLNLYTLPYLTDVHPLCTTLTHIVSQANWLEDKHAAAFDCFVNLEHLDLYYEEFQYFPVLAYQVRNSLKYLDVSRQYIDSVPTSELSGMISLEVLKAYELHVSQFPQFPHHMALIYIDLSSNGITNLDINDFKYLTNLTTLILTGNSLTGIPRLISIYEGTNTFLSIYAESNDFICDCDFSFALMGTDAYGFWNNVYINMSINPCLSPPSYFGVSYFDIDLPKTCGCK